MKTILLKYDDVLLKSIRNRQIVVVVDSLDSIMSQFVESARANNVVSMVAELPYVSLSQIEFQKEWADIPLIIKCYNIGDYDIFLAKVNAIKRLNCRIYLSGLSKTVYTDLKIMASIGVDCGICLNEDVNIDDEKLLDLASYYYMSPGQHATIEPFEYILRHMPEEQNNSFDTIYFDNPLMYVSLNSLEEIDNIDIENDFKLKVDNYYKHFMDIDECSKCPAFRICNKKMQTKLNQCSNTMNEIFEYAELCNEVNNNKCKQKTICQL